ncbi:hypothetical protein BZG36_02774 [Bifiguratus adelaidae]|uniref:DnaJ homologue subfamily C member 28 conserved domain-containing protein n=1 Tax=Bifiguratus adelaidae TaxID=1938954 RepID=A0A261Y1S9_9FUNG|nr:hypothetical protein BZG36_02774 [Bifiguratus adelaidae]
MQRWRVRAALVRPDLRAYSSSLAGKADEEENNANGRRSKVVEQLPSDPPWAGDESTHDAVLRMLMDKYSKPLRVEGAAKRNIPQPKSHLPPLSTQPVKPPTPAKIKLPVEELDAKQKSFLKETQARKAKQNRILHARDSAFDYATSGKNMVQNYPEEGEQRRPASLNDFRILVDDRIEAARARGEFDNLKGRHKPIPKDVHARNPFIDTTEYLMNRIVLRQGAAPAWIEMQKEVDSQVKQFRDGMIQQLELSLRAAEVDRSRHRRIDSMVIQTYRERHANYVTKAVEALNPKIRSYNVIAPFSVRKAYLSSEGEFELLFEKAHTHPFETSTSPASSATKTTESTESRDPPKGFLSRVWQSWTTN